MSLSLTLHVTRVQRFISDRTFTGKHTVNNSSWMGFYFMPSSKTQSTQKAEKNLNKDEFK